MASEQRTKNTITLKGSSQLVAEYLTFENQCAKSQAQAQHMQKNMVSVADKERVPEKLSLISKLWSYRGEGNANLVLNLIEEKKILRLRKSSGDGSKSDNEMNDQIWLEFSFCCHIMQPLLGECFVNIPTIVKLSKFEISDLNKHLSLCRPSYRGHKVLNCHFGALYPDLCILPHAISSSDAPTYCVEIKAKQGWIPIPDRRLSKCQFCLTQYLKLQKGLIKNKSQYCPLDLFSGNHRRMECAIHALLECPQNNLKLFKNGVLVHGESTSENYKAVLEDWFGRDGCVKPVDNFTGLLVGALLRDFPEGAGHKHLGSPSSRTAMPSARREGEEAAAPGRVPQNLLDEAQALLTQPSCYKSQDQLPERSILSRILKLQKLDEAGSDYVYNLYRSFPCIRDFDYVGDLLSSFDNIHKPINAYLLSTLAKDCSIMIAFQRIPSAEVDGKCHLKDSNGICYAFNAGLSDLDPKPASCIEKHRKRDYDMVVQCIEYLRANK